jgi:DGQHR domain-containing protein
VPKKRRKPKRTPNDLIKRRNRRFISDIRTAFTNSGFLQIPTREVEFSHAGFKTDFDAIFCKENTVVIAEDTTENNPSDHLRKKAETWEAMSKNSEEFIAALANRFAPFAKYLGDNSQFNQHDYQIRFVYISFRSINEEHIQRYPHIGFLDNARLQYFVNLSKTISRSTLFELLNFLNIDLAKFGIQTSASAETTYGGLYLPETPSGFTKGHKVVSLLMDPKTLLERTYVLRADGWKDSDALYQRLLVKNKIKEMRQYLRKEGRVFVNNVIVTFPHDTTLSHNGTLITADDSTLRTAVIPVDIRLPHRLASIGIVDGQHRIFAYHEGTDELEPYIAKLRVKQHLLVTGIVYPKSIATETAQQFEAKLFLEINDKQKRVRGDLKQAIEMIVTPRSAVAIAKAVVNSLAASQPFLDILETHAFDVGKLKTTSIVSYGLKYIVDPERDDSMFSRWKDTKKASFLTSRDALSAYISYCTSALRQYFNAFKEHVGDDMWTTDREKSRVLNATSINGLVFAMRRILENGPPPSFEECRKKFKKLTVSFEPSHFRFKSSHWKDLGERIFKDCF